MDIFDQVSRASNRLGPFSDCPCRVVANSVRLNDPFKGAELVTRYSEPRAGRHSLQIEINRRLYLDEAAIAKTADFDALRADMRRLIAGVVGYARKSV